MTIARAIEILDPEHRENYDGMGEVNEACRMGMEALKQTKWIPCSERLPEAETEVLALCNRDGYRFVCPAIYEDGKISEANSVWNWQELWVYDERDEENDCYLVPEGWWENRLFNQDDVCNNAIDCAVTHWMPLPGLPEEGGDGNGLD
nr:MAG TPA: Protein of unknown function (DUF551) [Caudoviricetes sp.]